MQSISRVGGDCTKKGGALCAYFIGMVSPMKNQVVNGMSKLFGFRGKTIYMSYQAVFSLKDSSIRDEEEKKINISNPITTTKW